MRKYFCFVIIVFANIIYAQNMLDNPGFETWSNDTTPANWQYDDSILVRKEDVISHSGNFSLKDSLFTTTQASADLWQGTYGIQPSTYYTCSFWIIDNDPAGRVQAGFWWYPTGSFWPNQYTADSPNWQQWYVDTLLSPANAESVTLWIRAYDVTSGWEGDAIFYIDDVFFGPTTTPQPPVINRIWHTPINPAPGIAVDVYAKASDSDGSIVADTLYYGVNNLVAPIKVTHNMTSNDTFRYQIPGQTSGDTVFYYLKFIDDDHLVASSDTLAYYVGKLNVFINEILYDTYGSDVGCFIELFRQGGQSLDGFSLVAVNGYDGAEYDTLDLSGHSIPGDGFFVIGDTSAVLNYDFIDPFTNLQNGPDNLELRFNNITIDALGYGSIGSFFFTGEWLPAPDVGPDTSLGRFPDGLDTDNNYLDFYAYATPTPGTPNPDLGVSEINHCPALPRVVNPVYAGLSFASIIDQRTMYPITVYNILGQVVDKALDPMTKLNLPAGVYFLKMNNFDKGSAKIVVVR